MTEIANPVQFAEAVIKGLGRSVNQGNLTGVTAWVLTEGGNWHNDAEFNPLNTTLVSEPCHDINSVGVKAYGSWDQGIAATIDTLNLGYYEGIRGAIEGSDAQGVATAVRDSKWGTGSIQGQLVEALALVRSDWVSAPGPAPVVVPVTPTQSDKEQHTMFLFTEKVIDNKEIVGDAAGVEAIWESDTHHFRHVGSLSDENVIKQAYPGISVLAVTGFVGAGFPLDAETAKLSGIAPAFPG